MASKDTFYSVLQSKRESILTSWLAQLEKVSASSKGRVSTAELRQQATDFLGLLVAASKTGAAYDSDSAEWASVRTFLEDLSRQRVLAGFSSDETATFIFSLKRPVFDALKQSASGDAESIAVGA